MPDAALPRGLHLLSGLEFAGTLLENLYLASVALSGEVRTARLRTLPGVHYARQGAIHDLGFAHDSLTVSFATRLAV